MRNEDADYYADKLSSESLRKCYELAPPRVMQYLAAEIAHVVDRLDPDSLVLELGCGYGRVVEQLAHEGYRVIGIDSAIGSIGTALGRHVELPPDVRERCVYTEMNAVDLRFHDGRFDAVVCIQNGISAFNVDKRRLVREALRVTRPGGRVLFSTYASIFWPHRLQWFELQSACGLLGPIDRTATGNGVIACEDGFRTGIVLPEEFLVLGQDVGIRPVLTEVDGSSLFCEFLKPDLRSARSSRIID